MQGPALTPEPDSVLSGESSPLEADAAARGVDRRKVIAQGIVWSISFQSFVAVASFGSMIVLVRLLSPSEFGRATAATSVLALINCFASSQFIAQAIQLNEGATPDWSTHWAAGSYIQLGLAAACNVVAGAAWLLPAYRPIAPLLHVASVGVLIDCPHQISLTMIRRDMDFRSLRLVQAACVATTIVSSISLAIANTGAFALVIGSHVLHGVPATFYLLVVRRWRPNDRWLRWPDWRNYRAPLRFGTQMSAVNLLTAARAVLEAAVLPPALGYEAVGLLNRAQVLFTTTVGRLNGIVLETVYPLLPRSASNPEQFRRHAAVYVETMLLISIPGTAFVAMEGLYLSRLLYGVRWAAADPLILPATLFAWGTAMGLIFSTVLQAQNRLRKTLGINFAAVLLALPALYVALFGRRTLEYAWAVAAAQVVAATIAAVIAKPALRPGWLKRGLSVGVSVAAAGVIGVSIVRFANVGSGLITRLAVDSSIFAVACLLVLRFGFAAIFRETVERLPKNQSLIKLLRL